jgi:hypothetical protein
VPWCDGLRHHWHLCLCSLNQRLRIGAGVCRTGLRVRALSWLRVDGSVAVACVSAGLAVLALFAKVSEFGARVVYTYNLAARHHTSSHHDCRSCIRWAADT